MVTIDSGELPSAVGKTGYDLEEVMRKWRQIASSRFKYDCSALLQMMEETDDLELWMYARDGWYKTRDEFLENCILIDFDFTTQSLTDIEKK